MKTQIATSLRFGGREVDFRAHTMDGPKITVRQGKFARRIGKKYGFSALSVEIIRWADGQKTIAINHSPDEFGNTCSVVWRHRTASLKSCSAVTHWRHQQMQSGLM
jgi:hypothetical protein